MPEILNAVPHRMFKTSERRCRVNLEAAIYNLPQDKYDLLIGASIAKGHRLDSTITSSVVHTDPFIANGDCLPDDNENGLFFETVSEQCRWDCLVNFIDATGRDAMATSICAVCVGSFFRSDTDTVSLSFLRATGKLKPLMFHPAHVLCMLLHHNPTCFSCLYFLTDLDEVDEAHFHDMF